MLMRLGVHCLAAYILVARPRPPGCALSHALNCLALLGRVCEGEVLETQG